MLLVRAVALGQTSTMRGRIELFGLLENNLLSFGILSSVGSVSADHTQLRVSEAIAEVRPPPDQAGARQQESRYRKEGRCHGELEEQRGRLAACSGTGWPVSPG